MTACESFTRWMKFIYRCTFSIVKFNSSEFRPYFFFHFFFEGLYTACSKQLIILIACLNVPDVKEAEYVSELNMVSSSCKNNLKTIRSTCSVYTEIGQGFLSFVTKEWIGIYGRWSRGEVIVSVQNHILRKFWRFLCVPTILEMRLCQENL